LHMTKNMASRFYHLDTSGILTFRGIAMIRIVAFRIFT
jgi:hypothetical protein